MKRRLALDLLPLASLAGVWLIAGLASAMTVAAAEGRLRYLALGVVTLPALAAIARAIGVLRARHVGVAR